MQNITAAIIMVLASTLSGFGAGFLFAVVKGQDRKDLHLMAIIGMATALIMMNAQIWMGYNGFKA